MNVSTKRVYKCLSYLKELNKVKVENKTSSVINICFFYQFIPGATFCFVDGKLVKKQKDGDPFSCHYEASHSPTCLLYCVLYWWYFQISSPGHGFIPSHMPRV